MRSINFEKSLEMASQNQNARELFSTLGQGFTPDKLKKTDAHKARPFVSEIAWALYSAYESVLLFAVMQLYMLKQGVKNSNLLKMDQVPNLVKAALPAYASYIEKNGLPGCYYLLDPLEAELLKELQRMLRGDESDKASVEQAAKIMKEVASVNLASSVISTSTTL